MLQNSEAEIPRGTLFGTRVERLRHSDAASSDHAWNATYHNYHPCNALIQRSVAVPAGKPYINMLQLLETLMGAFGWAGWIDCYFQPNGNADHQPPAAPLLKHSVLSKILDNNNKCSSSFGAPGFPFKIPSNMSAKASGGGCCVLRWFATFCSCHILWNKCNWTVLNFGQTGACLSIGNLFSMQHSWMITVGWHEHWCGILVVAGEDDLLIYGMPLWQNFAGGRTLESGRLQPRTKLSGCSTCRIL